MAEKSCSISALKLVQNNVMYLSFSLDYLCFSSYMLVAGESIYSTHIKNLSNDLDTQLVF